ncbi:MAG: hypothetical protein QF496_00845 [Dehalococcoidia bacterium]|nr:hypothetical protein [Dehalococcoidia bacterium]
MKKILSIILIITIGGFLITLIVQDILESQAKNNLLINKTNPQVNLKISPTSPPIPTSVPTSTPIPTPIPTSTPEPPSIGGKAMAFISSTYGINPSDLKLFKYEKKKWPSYAMGCPEPGKYYAQAETSGWVLHFIERNNTEYLIHTNEEGTNIIECNKNISEKTINIVEKLKLSTTKEIILRRLREEEYFEMAIIKEEDEITTIIQYLDIDLVASINQDVCVFLLELEFITKNTSKELKIICSDGKNFMKIEDNNPEKEIFEIPIELVNHLGKYAAQVPFPGIPEKPKTD